jgi:hypothetical protein
MKLSAPQQALLRRINRCPKGYALKPKEDQTAQILYEADLIRLIGIVAYPKEEK